MPKVSSHAIGAIFIRVTADPIGFDVFSDLSSPESKKSLATVKFGILQNFPYKKTT